MFLLEIKLPVTRLLGVGPGAAKGFSSLGIHNLGQLISHYPKGYENNRDPVPLRKAQGALETVRVNTLIQVVGSDWFGYGPKKTLKVQVMDRDGTQGVLVCFNRPFLAQKLLGGTTWHLIGNFLHKMGELQCSDFELSALPPQHTFANWQGEGVLGNLDPLYPLSAGLGQALVRKAVKQALKICLADLQEEIPMEIRTSQNLIPLGKALSDIHFPSDLTAVEPARNTLIFREFFHLQAVVTRRSLGLQDRRSPLFLPPHLRQELIRRLPFQLTPDQVKVIEEIDTDLSGPVPMARLLQGDVGSGKTLVAFLAALPLVEVGFQVALMAPTELLARQHAENAAKVLDPLGVSIAYLSGNISAKGRRPLLEQLEQGKISFIVGTHALFSQKVQFKNLRLVIIDEQHRFGVEQRQSLMQKGHSPDLLLMSATPIPRTLALTAFGDLAVSTIRTMPEGRKPIETHLAKVSNASKAYEFVRQELKQGRQAYFVYPLIETSESRSARDAQTALEFLSTQVYPEYTLGLIHSRIPDDEKDATMEAFSKGQIQILVATSVVEVGVDVANASCMVIEHAEIFGLSALHQLRGRVGRSSLQSYAFLLYGPNLSEDGKKRLLIMKETTDGFRIAEEDLKIRGPGDMTGLKQSGFLQLSIADFQRDAQILLNTRDLARRLFKDDPALDLPQNHCLKGALEQGPLFSPELLALG